MAAVDGKMAEHLGQPSKHFASKADRILFREGDAPDQIYFLRKGEATLKLTVDNQAIACFRVRACSLIGLSAVIGNRPYSTTASVGPDAVVEVVEPSEFFDLIDSHPELYFRVLRILAAENEAALQALANVLS